jgi:NADP-reducing hydrogenase subunit HndB
MFLEVCWMKSLKDLEAIRDRMKQEMSLRETENKTRIIVGMATCGIAAGARPIMAAFNQELELRGIRTASVSMTGCVGVCRYEPMCDIIDPNGDRTTYINLDAEMVRRIVVEHIVNRRPVTAYTIGAAQR